MKVSTMCNKLLLGVLAAASAAACHHDNPNYCPGALNDNCMNVDAAAVSCSTDTQCTIAGATVCDTATSMCVQCTADKPAACAGATPVCGGDDACQACTAHTQCATSACLPDGSCGDDTNVAYVDPAGSDNDTCTKATPCKVVAKALATKRPFIKFHGITDEAVIIELGRSVTFLADPSAQLTRGVGGPIVTVRDDNTSLKVYDLSISNGPNNVNGAGIVLQAGGTASVSLVRATVSNNPGGGIVASGGALTVSRSTVNGNRGGGIAVAGNGVSFDITNTFIYRNGDGSESTFGGLNLGVAVAGTNRLAFNTIVDNQSSINSAGVICAVPTLLAPNNIVARNAVAGSTTATAAQVSANGCQYPTSKIQSDAAGLTFVDSEAPAPFNYHLAAGSSAIDQATTPVDVAVDIDGDVRPQGAQKDIGADEYKQ